MNEWISLDETVCLCHGSGWAETNSEEWKTCDLHFKGQLHPHVKALLLDEPSKLAKEEDRSMLIFKIRTTQDSIKDLESSLKAKQSLLVQLELELINKTPTLPALYAISEEMKTTHD